MHKTAENAQNQVFRNSRFCENCDHTYIYITAYENYLETRAVDLRKSKRFLVRLNFSSA